MKIIKGNTTYTGVKELDGEIVCEKCGSLEAKMTCHIDGTDFYSTNYECECGNLISAVSQRSEEDKAYWA